MSNTKTIVLGSFLACLAALFQILPIFLSEVFVLLTMFSTIPIYIICRINPKIGVVATIASFLLVSLFSTHEALFFICTNGPVGASIGCCHHFINSKKLTIFISSIIVSCTLSIMNFIIGIPIFGAPLPGKFTVQILIIFIFSFIYNFIYYYFSALIFNKINKYTTVD